MCSFSCEYPVYCEVYSVSSSIEDCIRGSALGGCLCEDTEHRRPNPAIGRPVAYEAGRLYKPIYFFSLIVSFRWNSDHCGENIKDTKEKSARPSNDRGLLMWGHRTPWAQPRDRSPLLALQTNRCFFLLIVYFWRNSDHYQTQQWNLLGHQLIWGCLCGDIEHRGLNPGIDHPLLVCQANQKILLFIDCVFFAGIVTTMLIL